MANATSKSGTGMPTPSSATTWARKRGRDVEPPSPLWHDQQCAEQDDIGRPEQREYLIGERADVERRLRPEIVEEAEQYWPQRRCQLTHARQQRRHSNIGID